MSPIEIMTLLSFSSHVDVEPAALGPENLEVQQAIRVFKAIGYIEEGPIDGDGMMHLVLSEGGQLYVNALMHTPLAASRLVHADED